MLIDIIDKAISLKATDIHLKEGIYPVFRLNGEIKYMNCFEKLSLEDISNYKDILLNKKLTDLYKLKKSIDFSTSYKDKRIRGHIYRQKNKSSISLRLIDKEIKNLSSLNLPSSLAYFTKLNSGLVIITGITGMGKSTTLASIIETINKTYNKKIITLENPIEYTYEDKKSLIDQREIGVDVLSYEDGIKSALRSDPDIIVLGEVRDLESMESVITLAETGHLVFTTLHTRSVAETLNRIIDIFPLEKKEQISIELSNVLEGIICQRFYKNRKGKLVPNCEILIPNLAIRNLIRKGSNSNNILDMIYMTSNENGSQTKLQGLKKLYMKGEIDLNEIKNNLSGDEYELFKSIL